MTWVSFIFPAPPWLDQDVRASKRTSSSQISSMETPGESAGKPRFCEAPRPSLCQPHYVRLTLSIPGLSISWHWGSTAPEPAFQPLIYPSSAVMGKITPARGPCYIRCPLPPPSLPLQVHSSPSAAPSTPSRHLEGRGAQGEDKQICIQSSSTK